MARFDVMRGPGRPDLFLDCQADHLRYLQTRFVVPLVSLARAPPPIGRLNPVFDIEEHPWMMLTQAATAIAVRDLGVLVKSLADQEFIIGNALDLLVYGV